VIKNSLFFVPFIFFFSTLHAQKRIALIIGNADYEGNARLKNPVRDAELIASSLKNCAFQTILRTNLDLRNLVKAVDSFSRKIRESPSCIALFYYSGHGLQHNGENYIIPLHSSLDNNIDPDLEIKKECFQINEVLGAMQKAGSQMNIIILDACRDDPMSPAWGRGMGEKGLAVMSSVSDNTFIIYSTAPGRVAEDGAGRNSVFTQTLSKHILDSGIFIEDVFKRTKNDVVRLTKKQIPWSTSSLGVNFSFNTSGKPVQGNTPENKTNKTTADVVVTSLNNYNIVLNEDTLGTITETNPSIDLNLGPGEFYFKAISRQNPQRVITDTLHITEEDLQQGVPKLVKLMEENSNKEETTMKPNSPGNDRHLEDILNKIKYNMVLIHGGEFKMGDKMGYNDALPEHRVKLNSFYISKTEVTQEQWTAIMGSDNPSNFTVDCKNCPVENVSWDDAGKFISTLNSITKENYALPTEAEWEFAAMGAEEKSKFYFSGSNKLAPVGWFRENGENKTHPVGMKATNTNGIYDMSGNVAEWCSDWYDENYYNKIPPGATDPKGPSTGLLKVVRGGGWDCNETFCKVSTRSKYPPATRKSSIGFRLIRTDKE
jgi:formylglycine-generating enzyme required for sulfatase activity